eukprot:358645-Chlamydomonas_euryale.AAC.14
MACSCVAYVGASRPAVRNVRARERRRAALRLLVGEREREAQQTRQQLGRVAGDSRGARGAGPSCGGGDGPTCRGAVSDGGGGRGGDGATRGWLVGQHDAADGRCWRGGERKGQTAGTSTGT